MSTREDAPRAPEAAGEADREAGGEAGGEAARPPPLPRRVIDVFFAPGRLFAALREEPRWAGALVLGALLFMASTALIPAEMWVETMRQAMLESGRPVPPEFDPGAFGSMQKVFAVAGNGVFWFVLAFALAGLSALVFAFLLGDDGSYRQHLSVVAHAFLITAVGALLVVPLKITQGDLRLSLNLGLFFPFEEGWGARFLGALDLFWLWSFVVVGVGVHELDRRRSVGTAVLILLLVPLGLAALFAWISPV